MQEVAVRVAEGMVLVGVAMAVEAAMAQVMAWQVEVDKEQHSFGRTCSGLAREFHMPKCSIHQLH